MNYKINTQGTGGLGHLYLSDSNQRLLSSSGLSLRSLSSLQNLTTALLDNSSNLADIVKHLHDALATLVNSGLGGSSSLTLEGASSTGFLDELAETIRERLGGSGKRLAGSDLLVFLGKGFDLADVTEARSLNRLLLNLRILIRLETLDVVRAETEEAIPLLRLLDSVRASKLASVLELISSLL